MTVRPQSGKWRDACSADLERLCSAGPAPPRACLYRNEQELSDECWKAFIKPGRFDACLADLNKFCHKPSDLPDCIRRNEKVLSAPCQAFRAGKRVAKDGTVYEWGQLPASKPAQRKDAKP